ncbi:hypothetical protein [Aeromicrobium sp.]|uniref:hypothetical protein n=1 Tax=Aeromicrobium sp. TaxID=1871063 RepID=UPI0019B69A26|nr:hypothetical protein [Aeromicrobium sp.]MBC7633917.1 hypothetical protein [Aeromicrobium sp.]
MRRRLDEAGIGRDCLMWDDEDRRGQEGTWVLTRLPDNRIRAAMWDRGSEGIIEMYDDEQAAAAELGRRLLLLAPAPPHDKKDS